MIHDHLSPPKMSRNWKMVNLHELWKKRQHLGGPLEEYYLIIGGNHLSSFLIILVGTQSASHRKKLKTDFTRPKLSSTVAHVAEILSQDIKTPLASSPHLMSSHRCVKYNYCHNGRHNWRHQPKMSYNQMTQPHDKNRLISQIKTLQKIQSCNDNDTFHS